MTSSNGIAAGIAIPQSFPTGPVDLPLIRDIATKAEAMGYSGLWTHEDIAGRSHSLEPIAELSYAAAITSRIRLGISVIILPHRNAIQLAKTLATLDVLSEGRLDVGVGLGGVAIPAFDVAKGQRVSRFTETLEVMDALWREDAVTYDGKYYQLNKTPMVPKPVQKPRPPIWFGSRHENAIKRAVRYGDAWMGAGSSTMADFRAQYQTLRQALEEADRDPATFTISKRLYVAIDDNVDRAERSLEDFFDHNYGRPEMATQVSVWGSAEHCYERIDELRDAGAEHIVLDPVGDFDEHLHALRRYADGG